MKIERKFRPEIEGLRAVAALLVAVYHIWMMRVSGGVDVFFVVSGFLITTSLLSRYARDGYINFFSFIFGLLKRLLPNALLVLTVVLIASYFIMPEYRHAGIIKEIFASIFYFENWQLAISGTDYLNQGNEKSPVQHFWAMSIQGQFYVIWFLVISLAILIHKKFKIEFKKSFLGLLLILIAISFIFSVYLTGINQPLAYFDTRTRVWEFGLGGLLLLIIYRIKLPKFLSTIMGWSGLVILLSTGMLLDVENSFPGYIALLPVMAAVFILVAGENTSKLGVEKFLGSKFMVWLGGLSYGLYLWHWPLLSFYYVIFDTTDVSILHGILIIFISLVLSYLANRFLEKPINQLIGKNNFTFKKFLPIILQLGIVIILLGVWFIGSELKSSQQENLAGNSEHPGVLAEEISFSPEGTEPIPALENAKDDRADAYADGCQISPGDSEVKICEYGNTDDYDYTIALVGGSKSTHWLPSLQELGDNYRILNVTKSGCRFSLDNNESIADDCYEWNTKVVDELAEYNPDVVVALADVARPAYEEVPEGFIEQFEKLNNYDIPILAIRDTPYFAKDVVECLSQDNGINECSIEKSKTISPTPAWEKLSNPPENVMYVDYTDYICDEEKCPPVVGNIVAYLDKSHMTATFNKTFSPIIRKDLEKILLN
ncbi:acyltransferase family protein [Jeotgalicoccus psychrophilus]|uniref:acyltransferase family protein n=1 Tax=Jeotgalicoccus psychrophilus TaxID=157228 RepID=UPI0003FF0AB1|nr:acyltransferase family protein [Jeotgalicoccus psychrophilus]